MQTINDLQNSSLLCFNGFIDGEWLETEETFTVVNPFDQSALARVSDLSRAHIKLAINAADRAFQSWSVETAGHRAVLLRKWHRLIMDNLEDLALILTLEQGKPLKEARSEIAYGAGFIEWYAEEARRAYGDVIPGHGKDKRITVIKQPIGIVGAIAPWNFPNAMITRKVAPALAAGCTVILKPSELTPLSALALAQLAKDAGFPPGVFNVTPTFDAPMVGDELTANPLVKKISFTGSTSVGKLLMKKSAHRLKKITLELGGNAPFIVFDDADLEDAVAGAIASKFRNAGQTCVCANRLFVQASIYESFTELFVSATQDLTLGSGTSEETDIGPLIESKAMVSVDQMVEDARRHGGEILTGGKIAISNSLLYEPTIVAKASSKMRVFNEEIFGPVAPIFKFETEEEVIQMANATDHGLAAYFFGQNYARLWRVAEALEYGMVGINTGMISTPVAPFGGVKESGIGREGSKYGLEDYLNIKYICWGGVA